MNGQHEFKMNLGPNLSVGKDFAQVDYAPLYNFLEKMDAKKMTSMEAILKVWEFACVAHNLDRQDYLNRIDFLTKNNVELFAENNSMKEELAQCGMILQKSIQSSEKVDTSQMSLLTSAVLSDVLKEDSGVSGS